MKENLTKRLGDLEIRNKNLEDENSKIVQQITNTLYATLEDLKAKNELQKKLMNMSDEDKVISTYCSNFEIFDDYTFL